MQRALHGDAVADVPCDGCTACCTASQFVHVDPDEADTLAHIPREVLFPAPGLPPGHVLMGYDEHGACPMFVDGGMLDLRAPPAGVPRLRLPHLRGHRCRRGRRRQDGRGGACPQMALRVRDRGRRNARAVDAPGGPRSSTSIPSAPAPARPRASLRRTVPRQPSPSPRSSSTRAHRSTRCTRRSTRADHSAELRTAESCGRHTDVTPTGRHAPRRALVRLEARPRRVAPSRSRPRSRPSPPVSTWAIRSARPSAMALSLCCTA